MRKLERERERLIKLESGQAEQMYAKLRARGGLRHRQDAAKEALQSKKLKRFQAVLNTIVHDAPTPEQALAALRVIDALTRNAMKSCDSQYHVLDLTRARGRRGGHLAELLRRKNGMTFLIMLGYDAVQEIAPSDAEHELLYLCSEHNSQRLLKRVLDRITSMIQKARKSRLLQSHAQYVSDEDDDSMVTIDDVDELSPQLKHGTSPLVSSAVPTAVGSSTIEHEYDPMARGSMDVTDRFQKHRVPRRHVGFAVPLSGTELEAMEYKQDQEARPQRQQYQKIVQDEDEVEDSMMAIDEVDEPMEHGPRIQLVSPTHEYILTGSMNKADQSQKHHVAGKHFGFAGSFSSTLHEQDEPSFLTVSPSPLEDEL